MFWKKKAPKRTIKLAEAVWYESALYRVMSIRKDGVVEFAADVFFGGSSRMIQRMVKMQASELVFEEARQFWLAVNRPGTLYNPKPE